MRQRAHIVGTERTTGPREQASLGDATGVINYTDGGGGTVEGLLLSGGDAGIVGRAVQQRVPEFAPPLDVNDIEIFETGRGVLWLSEAGGLELQNFHIHDVTLNGIFLSGQLGEDAEIPPPELPLPEPTSPEEFLFKIENGLI